MVILGLLAAIGLSSFMSSQKKGRDARRKADLSAMQAAFELYYNDFNSYPLSGVGQTIDGCNSGSCNWNGLWEKNGTIYMVQIPQDPGGNVYRYVSNGTGYLLYARLENVQDTDVVQCSTGLGYYNTTGFDCGSGGCNYVVASSNTSPNELPTVLCE